MKYTYDYPRPSVTVDCVVFGIDSDAAGLNVLLIQRKKDPFAGRWAFPGGFVEADETLDQSARRELKEETGIKRLDLEQFQTFGDPGRDPRGHTVTVAYHALVRQRDHKPEAADDAAAAEWFPAARPPKLAFDHAKILKLALSHLRQSARRRPIGLGLLPAKFTLSQLRRLYEIVLGRPLDERTFRRKILGMNWLVELDEAQKDAARRAAKLYRFDRGRYRALAKHGFNFEM